MFRRFANLKRIHFVGVGGAGMSGIAEVLSDYDLEVSGCDLARSEVTDRLERLGVRFAEGHSVEHLADVDLVVKSSAVPLDNPELVAARERKITVVRRAEMLGELMRLKYGIAVAGTHGKTTTTSLIGTVLTAAGLDPTVIVGGRLRVSGTGARLGRSDYLVAEADEYDRSFLRLQPIIAVVTSIEREHLDTYLDLDEIRAAFHDFASRVPFFGEVIVCLDDANIQQMLPELAEHRVVSYGFSPQADLTAVEARTEGGGSRFAVEGPEGEPLGEIVLPMPGDHNVRNALAAVAVGRALGIELATVAEALADFKGVHRRFERLGRWRGAVVVDDYAHHPTEVSATLRAARQVYPKGRLLAVFQPHLYSRTRDQAEEFGRALLGADEALVTPVYPSREAPIEGVGSELIVAAARRSGHRHVTLCDGWPEVRRRLTERVREGDVVLTMGAGDVYRLAAELAEEGS